MKIQCVELDPQAKDNRPLGKSGAFLTGPTYSVDEIAEFTSRDAAETAGMRAPNRRPGYELWFSGGKVAGRDRHQLQHPAGLS